MNINIKDNVFHNDDYRYLIQYTEEAPYYYGEADRDITGPSGMIHTVDLESKISKSVHKKMQDTFPEEIAKYDSPHRVYINCFAPREDTYYHIDGERGSKTCLIYLSNTDWVPLLCGETFFYQDDKVIGVPPHPNRAVCFDGNILHKASSFRKGHRFTLALKYPPIK